MPKVLMKKRKKKLKSKKNYSDLMLENESPQYRRRGDLNAQLIKSDTLITTQVTQQFDIQ